MMSKKILAAALSVSSAMIPIVPTAMNATSTFAKSSRSQKSKAKKTKSKKSTAKKKSTNKKKPTHNRSFGYGYNVGSGDNVGTNGHSFGVSFGHSSRSFSHSKSW